MYNEEQNNLKKKIKPYLCNLLKEGISEWPSFSESDTFNQITGNATFAVTIQPHDSCDYLADLFSLDGDEEDDIVRIVKLYRINPQSVDAMFELIMST